MNETGVESEPEGLFVYGTLMRGECRAHHIEKASPTSRLVARCFGLDLYDLGDYPAMHASGESTSHETIQDRIDQLQSLVNNERHKAIRGEFIQVENLHDLIRELDEVEGYREDQPGDSWYLRAQVVVDLYDGKPRKAWTYLMGPQPNGPLISSGNWREARNRREDVRS